MIIPASAADLILVHSPQLDLSVVGSGHDQGHGGVEGGPVDSAIVALQDVLDHGVRVAKQFGRSHAPSTVVGAAHCRHGRLALLSQPCHKITPNCKSMKNVHFTNKIARSKR